MQSQENNIQIDINQVMSSWKSQVDQGEYDNVQSYSYSRYLDQPSIYQHDHYQQAINLLLSNHDLPINQPPGSPFRQYPILNREDDFFFEDSSHSKPSSLQSRTHQYNPNAATLTPQTSKTKPIQKKGKQRKKLEPINQSQKKEKGKKNQYDKNMVAYISAVMIKQLLTNESRPIVQHYCSLYKVDFEEFRAYFAQLQRRRQKLTTSKLMDIFQSTKHSQGFKKAFGSFMIGFLKYDYLAYIARDGKMEHQDKYWECATKMMFIPKLRREEYLKISSLMNQASDI